MNPLYLFNYLQLHFKLFHKCQILRPTQTCHFCCKENFISKNPASSLLSFNLRKLKDVWMTKDIMESWIRLKKEEKGRTRTKSSWWRFFKFNSSLWHDSFYAYTYHSAFCCWQVSMQLRLNNFKQWKCPKHGLLFQLTCYFQKLMPCDMIN